MEGFYLLAFFSEFSYILHVSNVITLSNFNKLYIEAEMYERKLNLCNHLWLRQSSFYVNYKLPSNSQMAGCLLLKVKELQTVHQVWNTFL